MVYDPKKIPKGTSNQAGFGQPGTAATRDQKAAGVGYNPNMPIGNQLAKQAAGGGYAGSGQQPIGAAPPVQAQPQGYTWQGADVGGQAYMPSTGQQIQFADPWQTMQIKGVPIFYEDPSKINIGGNQPGPYQQQMGAMPQGLPAPYASPSEMGFPVSYQGGGQGMVAPPAASPSAALESKRVGGGYAPPSPTPLGPYTPDIHGGQPYHPASYAEGLGEYTPPSPTPPPTTVGAGAYAGQVGGMPGVPYQPPVGPQPPPAPPEETFISQVPETPAGTGYAMLSGMPHADLLDMNKSMGISNISDLRQTQEQLSPIDMGAPMGDVELKSLSTAATKEKGWVEGGVGGVTGKEYPAVFYDEKTGRWMTKAEWEAAYGTGSWDESWEEPEGTPEEVGYENKYKKKDPDAVEEGVGEKLEKTGEDLEEGAWGGEDAGFQSKEYEAHLAGIDEEEDEQLELLGQSAWGAYQKQASAMERQYAMMGMGGSSNHMLANNALAIDLLNKLAEEQVQLGMYYDEKKFDAETRNMDQIEKDYQEWFAQWADVTGMQINWEQFDEDMQFKLMLSSLNTMFEMSDEIGGSFLSLMQSLEDLTDEQKAHHGGKILEFNMDFINCIGSDLGNMQKCAALYSDETTALMSKLQEQIEAKAEDPMYVCDPGWTLNGSKCQKFQGGSMQYKDATAYVKKG